jgi:hypothetical protein
MLRGRDQFTATVLPNGSVLMAGGLHALPGGATDSAEIYTP